MGYFSYKSELIRKLIDDALNVAKFDCNVIIQGETGVGKERMLDLLHKNSQRKDKPCVKINCGTIQESLAESEFFGYEKGAFTGAHSSGKPGYFEMANGGTLFLDEIGSLPLQMQSKLLRVLQDNTFYRVGGTEQKIVDVRVICANNVPLSELVESGKFREDLYYRLNVCMLEVPPLRKRREDVASLACTFIDEYSQKYGVTKTLSESAIKTLELHNWPGNVRELENAVHRLYINVGKNEIHGDDVARLIGSSIHDEMIFDMEWEVNTHSSLDFNAIMEEQEKRLIEYALKKEKTTRRAAEYLGLPQATLARKKVKYNL